MTVHDGKNAAGEDDASVDDSRNVIINVTNEDEEGRVSLDTDTPQADSLVTASLTDPDGGESSVAWTWESSADRSSWEVIDGASDAAYTPVAVDAEKYLQVTVSHTDGQGPGKSAQVETAGRVDGGPPTITSVAITSTPADGHTYRYQPPGTGNNNPIEVTVTFSEPVSGARIFDESLRFGGGFMRLMVTINRPFPLFLKEVAGTT